MKNDLRSVKLIDVLESGAIVIICMICCSAMTLLMPFRIYMILLIGLVLPVISFLKHDSIILNRFNILMLFFLGLMVLGIVQSIARVETIKFIIVFFSGFTMLIVKLSDKFFYKLLFYFKIILFFYAVSILINALIPNLFLEQLNFLIKPGMKSWISVEISSHIYSGVAGEKGEAAMLMVLGIAVGLSDIVKKGKPNWKDILYLFIVTIALILPAKRMLFAIGIMLYGIYAMLWTSKKKKFFVILLILIAAIGVIIFADYIPGMSVLLERFVEGGSDGALNGRSYLWERAIQMFHNKPILGYGYGTYNTFASYYGVKTSATGKWSYFAHNVYLELFAEMGATGGLVMIYLMLYGIFISFLLQWKGYMMSNSDRSMLFFSQCMQICLLIYNFTGNCLYSTNQIFIYFLVWVMILHLFEKYKNNLSASRKSIV